ncbi:Uncharacterized protein Fot_41373 [Forsythia ovata]|uniref:Uncharacterized protein n=1 Tax=Forsythia ovata TaxID=205694 RepID=A0ABD1RJ37_9LAMI
MDNLPVRLINYLAKMPQHVSQSIIKSRSSGSVHLFHLIKKRESLQPNILIITHEKSMCYPHKRDYQRDAVPLITLRPLQINYSGCNHRDNHETDINHDEQYRETCN